MARISEAILSCCFFLYKSKEDAETESRAGGTGFAVCVQIEDDPTRTWMRQYAVTAKHLIDKGCTFARINNKSGGFDVYELGPWRSAEADADGLLADVSVAHLTTPLHADSQPLPVGIGLWRTRFEEEDYGVGDNVFMIGRLMGQEGRVVNQVAVRFGNIAMIPTDPIWNYDLGSNSETILVEMRSEGGFSGSPVFVYKDGHPFGPTTRILGVDWGHLRATSHNHRSVEHAGIVCVTPFWRVLDLLLSAEMVKERGELAKTLPPQLLTDD